MIPGKKGVLKMLWVHGWGVVVEGFGLRGLGFGVRVSGFWVWGLGFRV